MQCEIEILPNKFLSQSSNGMNATMVSSVSKGVSCTNTISFNNQHKNIAALEENDEDDPPKHTIEKTSEATVGYEGMNPIYNQGNMKLTFRSRMSKTSHRCRRQRKNNNNINNNEEEGRKPHRGGDSVDEDTVDTRSTSSFDSSSSGDSHEEVDRLHPSTPQNPFHTGISNKVLHTYSGKPATVTTADIPAVLEHGMEYDIGIAEATRLGHISAEEHLWDSVSTGSSWPDSDDDPFYGAGGGESPFKVHAAYSLLNMKRGGGSLHASSSPFRPNDINMNVLQHPDGTEPGGTGGGTGTDLISSTFNNTDCTSGYTLPSNDSSTKLSSMSLYGSESTVVIFVDDFTFSPNTIIINKGTEVKFVSNNNISSIHKLNCDGLFDGMTLDDNITCNSFIFKYCGEFVVEDDIYSFMKCFISVVEVEDTSNSIQENIIEQELHSQNVIILENNQNKVHNNTIKNKYKIVQNGSNDNNINIVNKGEIGDLDDSFDEEEEEEEFNKMNLDFTDTLISKNTKKKKNKKRKNKVFLNNSKSNLLESSEATIHSSIVQLSQGSHVTSLNPTLTSLSMAPRLQGSFSHLHNTVSGTGSINTQCIPADTIKNENHQNDVDNDEDNIPEKNDMMPIFISIQKDRSITHFSDGYAAVSQNELNEKNASSYDKLYEKYNDCTDDNKHLSHHTMLNSSTLSSTKYLTEKPSGYRTSKSSYADRLADVSVDLSEEEEDDETSIRNIKEVSFHSTKHTLQSEMNDDNYNSNNIDKKEHGNDFFDRTDLSEVAVAMMELHTVGNKTNQQQLLESILNNNDNNISSLNENNMNNNTTLVENISITDKKKKKKKIKKKKKKMNSSLSDTNSNENTIPIVNNSNDDNGDDNNSKDDYDTTTDDYISSHLNSDINTIPELVLVDKDLDHLEMKSTVYCPTSNVSTVDSRLSSNVSTVDSRLSSSSTKLPLDLSLDLSKLLNDISAENDISSLCKGGSSANFAPISCPPTLARTSFDALTNPDMISSLRHLTTITTTRVVTSNTVSHSSTNISDSTHHFKGHSVLGLSGTSPSIYYPTVDTADNDVTCKANQNTQFDGIVSEFYDLESGMHTTNILHEIDSNIDMNDVNDPNLFLHANTRDKNNIITFTTAADTCVDIQQQQQQQDDQGGMVLLDSSTTAKKKKLKKKKKKVIQNITVEYATVNVDSEAVYSTQICAEDTTHVNNNNDTNDNCISDNCYIDETYVPGVNLEETSPVISGGTVDVLHHSTKDIENIVFSNDTVTLEDKKENSYLKLRMDNTTESMGANEEGHQTSVTSTHIIIKNNNNEGFTAVGDEAHKKTRKKKTKKKKLCQNESIVSNNENNGSSTIDRHFNNNMDGNDGEDLRTLDPPSSSHILIDSSSAKKSHTTSSTKSCNISTNDHDCSTSATTSNSASTSSSTKSARGESLRQDETSFRSSQSAMKSNHSTRSTNSNIDVIKCNQTLDIKLSIKSKIKHPKHVNDNHTLEHTQELTGTIGIRTPTESDTEIRMRKEMISSMLFLIIYV